MEDENKKDLTEYKRDELKEREDRLLAAEVRRDYEGYGEEELSLKDYVEVILRRKWIVISSLVIAIVTVTIASLLMDKIYRAEATIEISPETPKIISFEEVLAVEPRQREFYETQFKLLKSRSLAKEVVTTLQLDTHPAFAAHQDGELGLMSFMKNPIARILSLNNSTDPEGAEKKELIKEKKLVDSFLDGVKIKPDRKSRLVEVIFDSTDPELSATVANTLVDKYIEWVLDRKVEATKAARNFLEKQLQQVKAKLERAEEELNKFAKDKDIVSLDENFNLTYKLLAELNRASTEAETERLAREALYREVQAGDYAYLPQVISDLSIQALNEGYTKLKSQYDNLTVIFDEDYPDVKQLAAQLGRIKKDINERIDGIAKSIRKDYQTALRKDNLLSQRAQEQKRRVMELNEQTVQYKILDREVETNKSIYQNLLQRLKETEVTSGIRATNIQVVDYAETPLVPYKPNIKLNLLLATLMGLMGGVFLAFAFEHFDTTIKDEDEIKRKFALPFLGAIPLASEQEMPDIEKAVYLNPKSSIAEAFRVVRTAIMYSFPDSPLKSILITSAHPTEGKTTTASNLALSMIQSGHRVVLIDADLRNPRLHTIYLNNGNRFGLSTYLTGEMGLPGVIHQTGIDGLDIIPSGPIPPNPAELLGSKRVRELLEVLTQEYDYVLLDTAPIMGFADSRLLSGLADGVLIVTSVGITQRGALQSSIEAISKVRGSIVGAVVNRVDARRYKYHYGYYYYSGAELGKERKKIRFPRT
ncbi:MAG: polysaccharide biosynthesis tyrosine autokinase [Candidatus Dadabacteria bacterium]|nr:polysaccharide biosynthesis tyrosine autokinase [Candidatus Dadabacteria bacterium]